jgi:hypothetical protein
MGTHSFSTFPKRYVEKALDRVERAGKIDMPEMSRQAFKQIAADHGEIYTSSEQAKRVIQYK